MQHTNAWHGHCSIPLLIGQIWLPNSAVVNFLTRQQWLKIVNNTWRSSGATFFFLAIPVKIFPWRDHVTPNGLFVTEAWGIGKTVWQSERRHDGHVKLDIKFIRVINHRTPCIRVIRRFYITLLCSHSRRLYTQIAANGEERPVSPV